MEYIIFQDRDWTWLKFSDIPSEEVRTAIKDREGERFYWGRRKQAWYCKEAVSPEELTALIGPPLGVVKDRAPTKTWEYCMELAQLGLPGLSQPRPVTVSTRTGGDTKKAAKFRLMADKMTAQIEDKKRPMTQNWTRRRAGMYESRVREGERMEKVQCALYGLAEAYENEGPPDILKAISAKTQVEWLTLHDYFPRWAEDAARMLKAGIDDALYEQAHRAMLELANPPDHAADRKKRELETEIRGLVGQIPGYFPTPETIAQTLVQMADIRQGMSVLEPSAGSGNIARVICQRHPDAELKVIEWNMTLQEYLEAEGFEVIGNDFLQQTDSWDRIVQNPPFENKQDIRHTKHAYDLLSDDGRLVSVLAGNSEMAESKFNGWLDDKEAQFYDLPEGAFKESGTGVQSCFVVIDK